MEQRYEKLEMLGAGAFGKVYKVRRTSDNLEFAMKKFKNLDISMIISEIEALQKIDDPNIIRYIDSSLKPPYIVMEYCPSGSLSTLIKRGGIQEATALKIIKEVLDGLKICHSQKLIHRDLKPDNILIGKNQNHII